MSRRNNVICLPFVIKSHGFILFILIACCTDFGASGCTLSILFSLILYRFGGDYFSLNVRGAVAGRHYCSENTGEKLEGGGGTCLSGTGGQGRHILALSCAAFKLLCLHLRLERKGVINKQPLFHSGLLEHDVGMQLCLFSGIFCCWHSWTKLLGVRFFF